MNPAQQARHVKAFLASHGNGHRDLTEDEIHELAQTMGLKATQLPLGMRGGLQKIFFGDGNG
jgi:hypothetical protein